MRILVFISLLIISLNAFCQEVYTDKDFNLSISYPKADSVKRYDDKGVFNKTVFTYGNEIGGDAVQLIRETRAKTLDEFLVASRAERKEGGYESQVTEKKYTLKSGGKAVEITRDMGAARHIIHYFVFEQLPGTLMSLYYIESVHTLSFLKNRPKPAKEAYKIMVSSLVM